MIKACAFCGKDKLKIEVKQANKCIHRDKKTFYKLTAYTRCNCCHSRGPTTSILVENITNESVKEIENVSINLWNTRCNNDGSK